MIDIKEILLKRLLILIFQSDHYNENTYNFSQGYKRCLVDLINDLENYNSK